MSCADTSRSGRLERWRELAACGGFAARPVLPGERLELAYFGRLDVPAGPSGVCLWLALDVASGFVWSLLDDPSCGPLSEPRTELLARVQRDLAAWGWPLECVVTATDWRHPAAGPGWAAGGGFAEVSVELCGEWSVGWSCGPPGLTLDALGAVHRVLDSDFRRTSPALPMPPGAVDLRDAFASLVAERNFAVPCADGLRAGLTPDEILRTGVNR